MKTLLEKENKNNSVDEEDIDDNLVETVVSVFDQHSEGTSSLHILIKSLQDIIRRKGDKVEELKSKTKDLESKVAKLENEIDSYRISTAKEKVNIERYKRTILNLNKISKVVNPSSQDMVHKVSNASV